MEIMNLLLLALLIETVVTVVKPLWSRDGKRMSVAEGVSILLGVLLAVALKINLMTFLTDWAAVNDAPEWVKYVFYALTGIALGRGPSFLYDLWKGAQGMAEWFRMKEENEELVNVDLRMKRLKELEEEEKADMGIKDEDEGEYE